MNQIKEKKLETALCIKGWSDRTSNQDEMTGQGKIPGLWQKFQEAAQEEPRAPLCAYHSYDSDHLGPYTATVGYLVEKGREDMEIPTGLYLEFSSKGNGIPEIMALWQQVWEYPFEAEGYRRIYQVDLEEYRGDNCSVWVGVERI